MSLLNGKMPLCVEQSFSEILHEKDVTDTEQGRRYTCEELESKLLRESPFVLSLHAIHCTIFLNVDVLF